MKSTKSHTEPDSKPKQSSQKKAATGESSAANTGGAPATEEDIGTEGAGTERRESAQVDGETASLSKDGRRGKGKT